MTDKPDLDAAEGVVIQSKLSGLYHVKIIRVRDGRFNISTNGFPTEIEAWEALREWIKINGGQLTMDER